MSELIVNSAPTKPNAKQACIERLKYFLVLLQTLAKKSSFPDCLWSWFDWDILQGIVELLHIAQTEHIIPADIGWDLPQSTTTTTTIWSILLLQYKVLSVEKQAFEQEWKERTTSDQRILVCRWITEMHVFAELNTQWGSSKTKSTQVPRDFVGGQEVSWFVSRLWDILLYYGWVSAADDHDDTATTNDDLNICDQRCSVIEDICSLGCEQGPGTPAQLIHWLIEASQLPQYHEAFADRAKETPITSACWTNVCWTDVCWTMTDIPLLRQELKLHAQQHQQQQRLQTCYDALLSERNGLMRVWFLCSSGLQMRLRVSLSICHARGLKANSNNNQAAYAALVLQVWRDMEVVWGSSSPALCYFINILTELEQEHIIQQFQACCSDYLVTNNKARTHTILHLLIAAERVQSWLPERLLDRTGTLVFVNCN